MKTDTHPEYFTDAKITCANCDHVFTTGATKKEIRIEICSNCHPFFTGKKVLIDTEGRVDKFRQKADGATGKKKRSRKKKTLVERMNEEIAAQLGVEKAKDKAEAGRKLTKAKAKGKKRETDTREKEVKEMIEEAATEAPAEE